MDTAAGKISNCSQCFEGNQLIGEIPCGSLSVPSSLVARWNSYLSGSSRLPVEPESWLTELRDSSLG